jgi:hypothetical protein
MLFLNIFMNWVQQIQKRGPRLVRASIGNH